MSDAEREILGRIVRAAWVQYCIETGDSKTSHVTPWEGISEWDKEADRRIGEAVYAAAAAERDRLKAKLAAMQNALKAFDTYWLNTQLDTASESKARWDTFLELKHAALASAEGAKDE